MKILKFILKNFSAVENALKTSEIEIDFSNSKNTICLIIGPNGSGKTTILSMLHPFADIGNLDVRHGMKLILDDKEGYKEIVIEKNKRIYTIKHYYFPHKDKNHSVKSYIELDGCELNPNGNVTSFKEIVKEELQIETDYLKLIRLGSNVTSLIELSPTERKNFMGKIMEDIGIFLQYYKSVNNKLRHLDEIISHTIDKIKRLGIIDKDQYVEEIKKLRIALDDKQIIHTEMNKELAVYEDALSKIEDLDNLPNNVKEVTKKFNKMKSILERKSSLSSLDVEYYIKEIRSLELRLNAITTERAANVLLIENNLKLKNDYLEQIRSLEVQLKKEEESDIELVRMDDNLKKMRLKMREYEDNIGDYRAAYTLEELSSFIVFLKNTQQMLSRTYEFGKLPVEKVVDLMMKQKNVLHYIDKHLMELDDKKNDSASVFMNTLFARALLFPNQEVVISCKEECMAKNLFNQFMNLAKNSQTEDRTEDASFYHDMEHVYYNIKSIIEQFADYRFIIHELPDDVKMDFTSENIFNKIKELKLIYDEKKINELLSYATEYENYLKLVEQYKSDLALFKRFNEMSNIGMIKEQLKKFTESVDDANESIIEYKERNIEIDIELKELARSIESYSDIKETLEKFDEIKELYEKLTSDFEKAKSYRDSIYKLNIEISATKYNIDRMTEDLQKKIAGLSEYKKLNKELSKLNEKYDDFVYIKRSLSSKEGIPVKKMKMCLGNTEAITNELLDIVYDGRISLAEFNITASEFSMPFYNNHVLLPDVKYASQGEHSFLSISLSFALSSQVLSKYNIMLLDEIDGPLDLTNREKFIRILENQIERVKSEQSFLITHNAMFSSYPVDIIDLSFSNNREEYPLANFIKIRRK